MSDITKLVLVLTVSLLFLAGVAHLLERRAKARGSLFTGRSSPVLRIAALLLGLLLGGFTLFQVAFAGSVDLTTGSIAVALIAYALGAGQLLRLVQPEPKWLVATVDDGAFPTIIKVRSSPPSSATMSNHSNLLTIRWDYQPQGTDYLPSPEEDAQMMQFESALYTALRRTRAGFLMIVVTGSGKREWKCYSKDADQVTALADEALSNAGLTRARMTSQADHNWSEYDALYSSVQGNTVAQGQGPGFPPVL